MTLTFSSVNREGPVTITPPMSPSWMWNRPRQTTMHSALRLQARPRSAAQVRTPQIAARPAPRTCTPIRPWPSTLHLRRVARNPESPRMLTQTGDSLVMMQFSSSKCPFDTRTACELLERSLFPRCQSLDDEVVRPAPSEQVGGRYLEDDLGKGPSPTPAPGPSEDGQLLAIQPG